MVVADTSPINYLVQMEETHLLSIFFDQIVIPSGVQGELEHPLTPAHVRAWMQSPPAWLAVAQVQSIHSATQDLDFGEREAISLALELHASTLLIDDFEGRNVAAEFKLPTIGILKRAVFEKSIEGPNAYRKLSSTNFRISRALRESLRDLWVGDHQ